MKFINNLYWPDSEDHLLEHGENYQRNVRTVAISRVPEDKRNLCLDIGAHIGIASLHFAKYFEEVLSFEPIFETYRCLLANTNSVDNVYPLNIGLGDKERRVSFIQHEGNTGYTEPAEFDPTIPLSSSVFPLDDFNTELNPSLIKIDVEGFELLVLKGAEETIKRAKPVIVLEVKGIGFSRPDPLAPVNFLKELGYSVVEIINHDYVMEYRSA